MGPHHGRPWRVIIILGPTVPCVRILFTLTTADDIHLRGWCWVDWLAVYGEDAQIDSRGLSCLVYM